MFILSHFMDVLNAGIKKKPLAVMIKSSSLLLTVTRNLHGKEEKLVTLLDNLLVAVIQAKVSERVRKTCANEFTIIYERCLADPNQDTRDHLLRGISPRILAVVVDVNIGFGIRSSLLKSFNLGLTEFPIELRTEVFRELSREFEGLVDSLYSCGDFDMQASLMETLLRFTTKTIRSEVSNDWFPNYVKLQSVFIGTKGLESDYRKFLNLFNEGLAEKSKVFSYRLLSCVVEGQALIKPADVTDFWIDVNLGSESLSLYYSVKDRQVC